jgi:hypothetical protein
LTTTRKPSALPRRLRWRNSEECLREAEPRRAIASRKEEADKLREAMSLIERADPMLLAEIRAQRAVENVPLYASLRPPPGPSFGGQSPQHEAQIEAAEASMARQAAADRYETERWAKEREAQLADLIAGQSPGNQLQIRRTIRAGGG